jgi:hypothetical protein
MAAAGRGDTGVEARWPNVVEARTRPLISKIPALDAFNIGPPSYKTFPKIWVQ